MSDEHLNLIRDCVSKVLKSNSKSGISELMDMYEAGLITDIIQERLVYENPQVLSILVSLGIDPVEAVQLTAIEDRGHNITVLRTPSKQAVSVALIEPNFIKLWPETYEQFVKSHFKNNQILMNKWLRYAETVRTL